MGTPRLDNHHQYFWQTYQSLGSISPGLAEPNSRLVGILADQRMKFCDDTPFVATPPRQIIHRI